MEGKKKKYAYWMRPSMVEEMEDMLHEANATSKSEFVCRAVEFYMAYLRQNKSLEFLSTPTNGGGVNSDAEDYIHQPIYQESGQSQRR